MLGGDLRAVRGRIHSARLTEYSPAGRKAPEEDLRTESFGAIDLCETVILPRARLPPLIDSENPLGVKTKPNREPGLPTQALCPD